MTRFQLRFCMGFYLKSLALISLIGLVSGCGWQLAGTAQVGGVKPIKVSELKLVKETDNRSLHLALERAIALRDLEISSDAYVTLAVLKAKMEKRPYAYAYSSNGNPVQYQLELYVDYFFQAGDGHYLVPKRTIVARRQFDFQPSAVIAKKQEEDLLREEMYQEISQRILANTYK